MTTLVTMYPTYQGNDPKILVMPDNCSAAQVTEFFGKLVTAISSFQGGYDRTSVTFRLTQIDGDTLTELGTFEVSI